jgi:hypothetical protein
VRSRARGKMQIISCRGRESAFSVRARDMCADCRRGKSQIRFESLSAPATIAFGKGEDVVVDKINLFSRLAAENMYNQTNVIV